MWTINFVFKPFARCMPIPLWLIRSKYLAARFILIHLCALHFTARRARAFYQPMVASPCDLCEDAECSKICKTTPTTTQTSGSSPVCVMQLTTFVIVSVSVLLVQYYWFSLIHIYFFFFQPILTFIHTRCRGRRKDRERLRERARERKWLW